MLSRTLSKEEFVEVEGKVTCQMPGWPLKSRTNDYTNHVKQLETDGKKKEKTCIFSPLDTFEEFSIFTEFFFKRVLFPSIATLGSRKDLIHSKKKTGNPISKFIGSQKTLLYHSRHAGMGSPMRDYRYVGLLWLLYSISALSNVERW